MLPRIGPTGRALWLSLVLGLSPVAHTQPASEQVLKAGFVFNFAKFTDWPAGAVAANAPLQLCLAGGEAPTAFARAVEGRAVQGHLLVLRRTTKLEELRQCHIVYLSDLEERKLTDSLRVIRRLPILTISDSDGFVELGGMIGLVAEADRLQFEVNADAAQAAGLKISSQLLRLARHVKGRP